MGSTFLSDPAVSAAAARGEIGSQDALAASATFSRPGMHCLISRHSGTRRKVEPGASPKLPFEARATTFSSLPYTRRETGTQKTDHIFQTAEHACWSPSRTKTA